jgi:hypothetical protein
MIKFFRKIRQKLLAEGKTMNYLKYAIGEIVLVVIGILIALQINNWNTDRKNNVLKRSYYVQILQDLEKEKVLMTEANLHIDSFFARLQSYKDTFKEPDISIWGAATGIGKVFSTEAGQGWNLETNTNTIYTLINTGDIKLIPTEIRNKILDFRYKQSGLLDYAKSQSIIISNASIATEKLYGGADLPTRIGNQPKLIEYFNDEKIALQSLLQLEALLYEEALLLKNAYKRSNKLIQDIEEIKKVIHEELEK